MAVRVFADDPVLAALARAPVGEPLPPELEAEYAQREADVTGDIGRVTWRSHDDVVQALAARAQG